VDHSRRLALLKRPPIQRQRGSVRIEPAPRTKRSNGRKSDIEQACVGASLVTIAMNSAVATTAPTGAALVLDVDALWARLPAALRAQITWVQAPITEGLQKLRTATLSDDLLDEVAGTLMRPLQTLSRAYVNLMASNRDEVRAALMADLERDAQLVQDYLNDPDAADTAKWVLGFLRSFFGTVLTLVEPGHLADIDFDAMEKAMNKPDACSFLRGQVAIMGAIDGVKNDASKERVTELIDIAFLQLIDVRDQFRKLGVWLSAFPDETSEQRRRDALRYAGRLRELVTDEEWQAFDRARLGNLR
jgi:hypothetical protein